MQSVTEVSYFEPQERYQHQKTIQIYRYNDISCDDKKTYRENVWLLSEQFHRCLDSPEELACPRDAAGNWRQITSDYGFTLLVLIDPANGLQVSCIGTKNVKILGIQIKLRRCNHLEFSQ